MTIAGDKHDSTAPRVDEATCVASPVAKRRSIPESIDTASSGTGQASGANFSLTFSSPVDALHAEEVERTRVFAKLSVVLCVLLVIGVPFLGGNEVVRYLFIGAVVGSGLQAAWVVLVLRDPARYSVMWITLLALWASLTTYVGVLYIGIFSVTPTAAVVGIYFFGRSQSRHAALLIYTLVAGLQALLATLILTNVMSDPGIFNADNVPMRVRVFIQLLVQVTFFIAYALSRATRASSLRAIEDLQRAMRHVSQREALFQEVRRDLDNALMVAGGGRYSDQEIGSFKLGLVIGRGAMAEVYEAVHVVSGDRAAVKLLHSNILENADSAQRFLREAQAAGALDSPNAVRVLETSPAGAALPYLAMELLEGHDLAYWLRKRRRLSIREVIELVNQVAMVLDLAATHNVVHRDLKPQNLFRHEPRDGLYQWKILDFGMATLGENAGTLTGGHVVGTPAYMAPEQARGKQVDTRADLYSLAAVAYRCLTGRAPFAAKDIPSLLYSVVYDTPPQPSSLVKIPEQVDDVFAVALAKKRSNRFASGSELSEAFTAAAEGKTDDWLQRRAEALLLEQAWDTRK